MFGISLLILCFGLRYHRHNALVAGSLVEVHNTVGQCIEGVILADTYILAGVVLGATLANDDVAGDNFLATPNLNAESLSC